jgi:NADH-quinone oxidoreductase subunit C
VAEFDPLTISDEELKQLAPADRAKVYKARAAARAGGGAAPAPAAASAPPAAPPSGEVKAEVPAPPPAGEAKEAAPAAAAPVAPPSEETKEAPPAAPKEPEKPAEPEKPKEPDFVGKVLAAIPEASWQWRHGYAEVKVPREQLLDAARSLRESGFDYLSFITEVDWNDRLELIYHLYSYDYKAQPLGAILRTDLPREGMPAVASLTTIWPGAEFMEREAFEMMGIRFMGHPDLRRILLPDDFRGFPMRRDFQTDFEYITVKQLVRDHD